MCEPKCRILFVFMALMYPSLLLAIDEVEPNNTIEGAQVVTAVEGQVQTTLDPEDTDVYFISVDGPQVLALSFQGPNNMGIQMAAKSNTGSYRGIKCMDGGGILESSILAYVSDEESGVYVYLTRIRIDENEEDPLFNEPASYQLSYIVGSGTGVGPSFDPSNETLSINEGETVDVNNQAQASDPDNALQYTQITISGFATRSGTETDPTTGHFQWTSGYNHAGTTECIIVATETGADPTWPELGRLAFKRITIEVQDVNRSPVLAGPTHAIVEQGGYLDLRYDIRDPDYDDLEVTVTLNGIELPDMANWNWRHFFWNTSEADPGIYVLFIVVTETSTGDIFTLSTEIDIQPDIGESYAPTLSSLNVRESHEIGKTIYTFSGIYDDADAGASTATREVQVATDQSFEQDSIVASPGPIPCDNPLSSARSGERIDAYVVANLESGVTYYWRMRVIDNDGDSSGWVMGPSFVPKERPQFPLDDMPQPVADASIEDTPELPYRASDLLLNGTNELVVLLHANEDDLVWIDIECEEGAIFEVDLWYRESSTQGRQYYHRKSRTNAAGLHTRLSFYSDVTGEFVLWVRLADGETGERAISRIVISLPKQGDTENPSVNERVLGDAENTNPDEIDSEPTIPKSKLKYGSSRTWATPKNPPEGSNPPESDCEWKVYVKLMYEIEDNDSDSKIIVKEDGGSYSVVINGDTVDRYDEIETIRRACGGYAFTQAGVRAAFVRSGNKYKDEDVTVTEEVTATAEQVYGDWQLEAIWNGDCGTSRVYAHAYSELKGSLILKADWEGYGIEGDAEVEDIAAYSLKTATVRSIKCNEIALEVETELAFGVEKIRESETIQIPSGYTDLGGAAVGISNVVLDYVQTNLSGSSQITKHVKPDDSTKAYADDRRDGSVKRAVFIIRSASGSRVSIARPNPTTFGSEGEVESLKWNNAAYIGSNTAEMFLAISLICESNAADACVGDIIRLLYEQGDHTGIEDSIPQDFRIESDPGDPNKKAAALPRPAEDEAKRHPSEKRVESKSTLVGENVDTDD